MVVVFGGVFEWSGRIIFDIFGLRLDWGIKSGFGMIVGVLISLLEWPSHFYMSMLQIARCVGDLLVQQSGWVGGLGRSWNVQFQYGFNDWEVELGGFFFIKWKLKRNGEFDTLSIIL